MSTARDRWLAQRRQYVTATDAAAILGVHPYRCALDVYLSKVAGTRQPETEAMRLGRELEPVLFELWREREGLGIRLCRRWKALTLVAGPGRLSSTPDAVYGLGNATSPIELKITNGRGWKSGPPIYYQIQLQVQIACLGADRGWIVALVGGTEIKQWEISRHPGVIELVTEAADRFWRDHIDAGDPPWPDRDSPAQEQYAAALAELYPVGRELEAAPLPPAADTWREQLQAARQIRKVAEGYERAAANLLKRALGTAAYGVTPGGAVVAWSGANGRRSLRLPKRLPAGVALPEKDTDHG